MFEPYDNDTGVLNIKLIGVGGGGCNAVQHMVTSGIAGVEFICANTDAQALQAMQASTILHIGQSITKGLGAGANPEIGRQAAMEDRDRIQSLIEGTNMLFITAGMGGGTGTGALPVVAQIARELGVLTVAVITKPFNLEGNKRMAMAEAGIEELRSQVDSLITIPNEKLLTVLGKNTSMLDAFGAANDVLRGAVQGIAELVTKPGFMNVDFADVSTVMSEMGLAMMGTGIGRGDERATEAAQMAISSPLLEDIELAGARGILVNITAGLDLAIGEFEEVGNVIREIAADDANVVVGTAIDEDLDGELRVTVVATGLVKPEARSLRDSRTGMAGGAAARVRPINTRSPAYAGGGPAGRGGNGGTPIGARQNQQDSPSRFDHYGEGSTVTHKTARGTGQHASTAASYQGQDESILDIPAFLRRQAD